MKTNFANPKKKYIVSVKMRGESAGVLFVMEVNKLETWAVSKQKAESNVRFRTEGKAYWFEEHGNDYNYHYYEYEAREA